MKDTGNISITIHGRISSVQWLEQAPWNAKKVRGEKYVEYHLSGLTQSQYRDLEDSLEGVEKVWTSEPMPEYEWEAPHPAFAGIAKALKGNPHLQRTELITHSLMFAEPDNDDCLDFALHQIEKTINRLEARHYTQEVQEVKAIFQDVEHRGGDAYAEHKTRLIELNNLL